MRRLGREPGTHIRTSKVLGSMSITVLRPRTVRLRRASSTFAWLGRLSLPSASAALTQDERYRTNYPGYFLV